MPGPFEPIVPKSAIQPAQDYLDTPSLERGPWEARLRGFGAGALEGLRGQTSPANLVGLLASGVGGRAIPALKGAAGAVGGLARAIPRGFQAAEELPALGSAMAEFTPSGGEALYNAGKEVVKHSTPGAKLAEEAPNYLDMFNRAKAQRGF